ncbi:MAG TPA: response regulator transcription factor [Candidatus Thioglobus sp.]|jgi:FixJ family two-component response regulator|nr:response regulator transcription factor [Candidatus Thioglobus sp.]HIB30623.1 response regulator transcription factor [Candidatus Thioglobus sp.]
MKNNPLHVFIVDDDKKVCDSLSNFFKLHDFEVNTYTSAQSYLDDLDRNYMGCLVSDIDMEDMTGLELQDSLNKIGCIRPTIFITGHANVNIAVEAMKLGALDFFEKPFDPDLLLTKVTDAINLFSEKIFILGCYNLLTQKEIEVFKLVISGDKNRSIADKLFISIPTVEAHRSKVMKKMKVKSVAELVRLSTLLNNNG